MKHVIAVGIVVGALTWCCAAPAQDFDRPMCMEFSIRGSAKMPAVAGWHEPETDGALVPDGLQSYQVSIRHYFGESTRTDVEAALEQLKSYKGGLNCAPPQPLLREMLASVKGADGRIFTVVASTNPATHWRAVFAYSAKDGKLATYILEGEQPLVEKYYAVFAGILRRSQAP